MTQRATIKACDLNRYLKAAKTHGFAVEIDGDKVRLLPTEATSPVPSDQESEGEAAWDKALGLR